MLASTGWLGSATLLVMYKKPSAKTHSPLHLSKRCLGTFSRSKESCARELLLYSKTWQLNISGIWRWLRGQCPAQWKSSRILYFPCFNTETSFREMQNQKWLGSTATSVGLVTKSRLCSSAALGFFLLNALSLAISTTLDWRPGFAARFGAGFHAIRFRWDNLTHLVEIFVHLRWQYTPHKRVIRNWYGKVLTVLDCQKFNNWVFFTSNKHWRKDTSWWPKARLVVAVEQCLTWQYKTRTSIKK